MSFDCRTWNSVAYNLIEHTPTPDLEEAYLRTAIGRSYYSVLGIAKELLILQGIPRSALDKHDKVRQEYERHRLGSPEREVATNLKRLYEERCDADYEPDADIGKGRAETAYELAINTLNRLDTLIRPYRPAP